MNSPLGVSPEGLGCDVIIEMLELIELFIGRSTLHDHEQLSLQRGQAESFCPKAKCLVLRSPVEPASRRLAQHLSLHSRVVARASDALKITRSFILASNRGDIASQTPPPLIRLKFCRAHPRAHGPFLVMSHIPARDAEPVETAGLFPLLLPSPKHFSLGLEPSEFRIGGEVGFQRREFSDHDRWFRTSR